MTEQFVGTFAIVFELDTVVTWEKWLRCGWKHPD